MNSLPVALHQAGISNFIPSSVAEISSISPTFMLFIISAVLITGMGQSKPKQSKLLSNLISLLTLKTQYNPHPGLNQTNNLSFTTFSLREKDWELNYRPLSL